MKCVWVIEHGKIYTCGYGFRCVHCDRTIGATHYANNAEDYQDECPANPKPMPVVPHRFGKIFANGEDRMLIEQIELHVDQLIDCVADLQERAK